MNSFYTKIIELINSVTIKDKSKPDFVTCKHYNHIDNMGCFGHHTPLIEHNCLRCISLDRYNWLYIYIDCDLRTDQIDVIRTQGLYVHRSLLDVEAGVLPCDIAERVQDAIDANTRYRGMVFAIRSGEALEALTFYGITKGYFPVYIYKGEIVSEYNVLEKLFNSGYGKLIADIEANIKVLNLK